MKCQIKVEHKAKRPFFRKRSRSEPLLRDPESAVKRQALKRLFGRVRSAELEDQPAADENVLVEDLDNREYADENEDPLLDTVPVNMDPEQLGFLLCAQETLRFLNRRGIPRHHPVFVTLRSRLLEGIDEIAYA